MKDIKDTCFVIQARLSSERVPRKMIKPFASTSLVDIACKKIKESKIIPKENFYFSAYEKEIIDVVEKNNLQIYYRSQRSATSEGPMQEVMEYHNKLNYRYLVVISACCPLLKIETIDNFVKAYLSSPYNGMFGVVEKRNYFWDENHNLITPWQELSRPGSDVLNTKLVCKTYEAAHCLYAGRMDEIAKGVWMAKTPYTKNNPELFPMSEFEAFDIDYPWQFERAEILYRELS